MYSVLQACNTEKTPLSGTALAPIYVLKKKLMEVLHIFSFYNLQYSNSIIASDFHYI